MIESLLEVLGAGLRLWEHKEKTKYQRKFYELQKIYYELQKQNPINDAALGQCEFELRILGRSFASQIKGSQAEDLPQ